MQENIYQMYGHLAFINHWSPQAIDALFFDEIKKYYKIAVSIYKQANSVKTKNGRE